MEAAERYRHCKLVFMAEDIASIQSIYRYPVKSMAGQMVARCDLTADGLDGDRLFAVESSGAPAGMHRLTARERREMLAYQSFTGADGTVEVRVPTGERVLLDSPGMIDYLATHMPGTSRFTLSKASTPQTDVRPLSLISLQTIDQLSRELGETIDPRRFRANLYLDFPAGPFMEDGLAGRAVRIGPSATVLIRERDPRCRFITYDPQSPVDAAPLFSLMKLLDRRHEGRAGVYATVVDPGLLQTGDAIQMVE